MDGRLQRRSTLELFSALLELPSEERTAALEAECGGDSELRHRLEELLAASEDEGFLAAGSLFDRSEIAQLLAEPDAPATGEVWGNYRTVGELGRGGMGVVFRAERSDGAFRHEVALKVLPPGAGADDRRRFELERQLLAGLEHPAIARLLDGGIGLSGQPYLVMELVEGAPITEHCVRRQLGVDDVLRLFLGVCEAVEAAHQRLIVHRDIKPSNVLVKEDGSVKLLDFGIAKLLDPDRGGETRVLQRLGTLDYVSPEMYRGEPVGVASDVYQLGVLLYELLAGHPPRRLSELNAAERDRAMDEDVTAPPSAGHGERPSDLDTIVLKALRADPGRRYGSVRALREDLERLLGGFPVLARGDSLLYAASKLVGRHRLPAALVLGALVLMVSVVTGYTLLLREQRAAATAAAQEAERERVGAEAAVGYLLELIDAGNPDLGGSGDVPARELFADAADGLEERFPDHPLLRARLMHSLGRVLYRLGDFRSARELAADSVASRERELGVDHPLVAESLVGLADIEQGSGDFDQGAEHYLRAIAILDGLSDQQPLLERALASLARVRVYQDRPEEGLTLVERAIHLCTQRLGPGGWDCSTFVATAAAALRWMGRTEEARDLFADLATDYARDLPTDHPLLTTALDGLASAEMALGNPDEAERLYRRQIEIARSALGARHPTVARGLIRLATIRRLRGDPDGAVGPLEEALSILEAAGGSPLGPLSGRIAMAQGELVRALLEAGRVDDAEALANRAFQLVYRHRGEAPDVYCHAVTALGEVVYKQGRLVPAERLFREALELSETSYGQEHFATGWARYLLGRTLLDLGRPVEAEEQLERAYLSVVRLASPRSLETALVLEALAASHHALGEIEAAREEWTAVVGVRSAQLPPDHPDLVAARGQLAQLPATGP